MERSTLVLASLAPLFVLAVVACGGETPPAQSPSGGASSDTASPAEATTTAHHQCGVNDKLHTHDLNSEGRSEAFVPCAQAGHTDYSGLIQIETIPEGVHILIHATDDQVNLGLLGADVKTRDAVIVYPRGKGSKAVEVPLVKHATGYQGDKIVLWEDLDKLTDEGTTIHIAVFDHDKKTGESAEEMHVSVAVSSGKSCEKAQDENPQTIDMGGAKGGKGSRPDLSDEQLGAPMKTSSWFSSCGLADSANADICVAVKNGKPLGVSVGVTPENKRVAACIDRAARKLHFPESEKLDVVHQKF